MKTNVINRSILVASVLIIWNLTLNAQEGIDIRIKPVSEIFCFTKGNHCTKDNCLTDKGESLQLQSERLSKVNGKRKARLVRKLKRSLDSYIKGFDKDFAALIAKVKRTKRIRHILYVIKLKELNKHIIEELESMPEWLNDPFFEEALPKLKGFQYRIESSLKQIQ